MQMGSGRPARRTDGADVLPGNEFTVTATARVPEGFDVSASTFDLIARHRVTMTALVPPLALVWLEAFAASAADLSSLQVLQVGGAKLNPASARRIGPELGCRLQQVFGMAEGQKDSPTGSLATLAACA